MPRIAAFWEGYFEDACIPGTIYARVLSFGPITGGTGKTYPAYAKNVSIGHLLVSLCKVWTCIQNVQSVHYPAMTIVKQTVLSVNASTVHFVVYVCNTLHFSV